MMEDIEEISYKVLLSSIQVTAVSLIQQAIQTYQYTMSYVAGKDDKEGVEAGFNAKSHKIRITLTAQGPKLKALEKGEHIHNHVSRCG